MNAVTRRIVAPTVNDKSKKYTVSATAVNINENTKPNTWFIGNNSFKLHHSFQEDEAKDEDPYYV